MPLSAGTRLGHYDVTALIGEGGMGQVYQATDTQLNRQVALKILPDAFAADPERLAKNGEFVDLVFGDDQLMKALNALMLDRVYERLSAIDDATAAPGQPQ
jgi:serine/threonine protein kinase